MHFSMTTEAFRLRFTWRAYVILLHASHRTCLLTLAVRLEERIGLLKHEKRFQKRGRMQDRYGMR